MDGVAEARGAVFQGAGGEAAVHVAIQVLGSRRDLVPTLTELAGPLGLTQGQPGVGNST